MSVVGPDGGNIRWLSHSFTFIADSETTTLTFRDVSTTSDGIDMVLDKVRVIVPPSANQTVEFSQWISPGGILGAPMDDSDGDSINNALEYVIGGDPQGGFDADLLPTMNMVSADLDETQGEELHALHLPLHPCSGRRS